MSRRHRRRRHELAAAVVVDLGPATPRTDRVPCRSCYLPVRLVGDVWEHLTAGVCTTPAPSTLAEWEAAYASWRGVSLAELHELGVHAEVCSCDLEDCTGFLLVDVHTCALWCDRRRARGLPIPPARELW